LKINNYKSIHCFLSFTIVIFTIIHATLLLNGVYNWGDEPTIYGALALSILGTLTIMGFSNKWSITKINKKKWKSIHLVLSILVVIIVMVHSIIFGYHFFGVGP
jgi:cytochrome b561